MAESTTCTAEEWERWRNAIHTLYILQNLPLGGPSGVIETMKRRYGFRATKRQYEYRFQQWGLEKNMPGGNYPIIASKLGKRKAAGKESNVFWKGVLVPASKVRKETARHGYMTTYERVSQAQDPVAAEPPETPPGVDICTPPPYPQFRRVFQELPILKFLRSGKTTLEVAGAQSSESNLSTLCSILRLPAAVERLINFVRVLAAARSLVPISAFENKSSPPATILGNVHDNASSQVVLKVVVYLALNNFPGNCNRAEMQKLLKTLYTSNPGIFRLLQEPSSQGLLQGLLRLAVEEGDTQTAGVLLDAGADPNGTLCVHKSCPIPLTPLQYACLDGNLELVKQLLRARAQIDHPEFGWCCSPLLFAICGYQESWNKTHATWSIDIDEVADTDQRQVEALITLIRELLKAGADVNAVAEDLGATDYSEAREKWKDTYQAVPDSPMFFLTCGKHSALTLGAAFRCPELVNLLIQNGANVGLQANGRSAIRECLYNPGERFLARDENLPSLLNNRLEELWCDDDRALLLRRVVETASSLIEAEVDVNDHATCGTGDGCKHRDIECYSALDLGLLAQDKNLVDALWAAKAKPTHHALEIAMEALEDYDLFCQLLDANVPLPRWAFTGDELWPGGPQETAELPKRRAMVLAAIWLGSWTSLQRLAGSYDCSNIFGNLGSDGSNANDGNVGSCATALKRAIEQCARRGHHVTLACLVRSGILPQDPPASVFGSSVALALQSWHLQAAVTLIKAGADVNACIPHYSEPLDVSPLQLAIEQKNEGVVQKLIHHGANAENPDAGNLLVRAIQRGGGQVIQHLMGIASINSSGRFEFKVPYQLNGRGLCKLCQWPSPLAAAITDEQWALADELLQVGASVNPSCGGALQVGAFRARCMTPLWASVHRKNITLFRRLIDNGAEVNDEAALEFAANHEDSAILRMFVEELSTGKRKGKANALHVALHSAMSYGHMKNVRLILDSKIVDMDAYSNRKTLLYHALHVFPASHRQEFLRLLLGAGASPDIITDDFTERKDHEHPRTALLEAIWLQNPNYVRIILEKQARTGGRFPPEAAYSPLQLAAFGGNLTIVEMLLIYGYDPDIVSPCAEVYKLTNKLMRYDIGTSVQNATMEKHRDVLMMLLMRGANPNSTTRHFRHTALQIACRDGSIKLVELLLEYGADVNAPPAERYGGTALQFAAIGGYLGIAHRLLEMGADVNAAPAPFEGRTAFEGAAENGRVDMVQLLKNAGADISEAGSETGQGQFERAWERATKNGHMAIRALLKSYLS